MQLSAATTASRRPVTAGATDRALTAVDRDALLALASPNCQVWVSLLMTTRPGNRTHDDITLRNLVRAATAALREADVPENTAKTVLRRLSRNADGPDWRRSNGQGLALFASPERTVTVRVPGTLPDVAAVGDRAFVGPLVSAVLGHRHTVILALSGDEVQLFQVTADGINELPLEGLPLATLATLPRPRRQLHAFVADRGNGGAHAVFYGSGTETNVAEKTALRRYFRHVDDAMQATFGGQQSLLILAGVAETQALYREVSTYPQLLDEGITGAVRGMTLRDLHDRAWAICEAAVQQSAAEPLTLLRALVGTGRTMDEPAHVAAAAQAGRIDTLFLSQDPKVWRPADGGRALDLAGSGFPVNLDTAAVGTLQSGGSVYAVRQSELPSRSPVAAIIRN
jgi:hypothetical protein